ncbi:cysteine hydrolase [Rhodococcus opacus]|nr:cysteine hydrolase [Rhodococcus opacus]RZL83023.1 MAG: cysteine hydrolase [Rhodococcus sp. (in: high G+C Gram-positive bacteria)]
MTTAQRTALIIGDMQTGILANFPFAERVLPGIAATLPAARRRGVDIIYLRAGLRPTPDDIGDGNTLFRKFFDLGDLFHETSPHTDVDPRIAPAPTDTVVLKRRTSGFAHTDLDLVLRTRGITEFAICGVATGAMIAATAYAAADLDYGVTVLRDLCADDNDDIHTFLCDHLFPSRGMTVTTAAAWLDNPTAQQH